MWYSRRFLRSRFILIKSTDPYSKRIVLAGSRARTHSTCDSLRGWSAAPRYIHVCLRDASGCVCVCVCLSFLGLTARASDGAGACGTCASNITCGPRQLAGDRGRNRATARTTSLLFIEGYSQHIYICARESRLHPCNIFT